MIVDASVLVAILDGEDDGESYERILVRAEFRRMSPVNWFETATVLTSRSTRSREALDAYVARAQIEIVPVDIQHMKMADQAWQKFGKGRHPARLNLGDCFAYALAKSLGEPLLFKGRRFS